MLGQERFNKVFVQGRKCVEHKKWTPQSYEYGEHDDEYSKRFPLVMRHLLMIVAVGGVAARVCGGCCY
jgi:hypothetical protein